MIRACWERVSRKRGPPQHRRKCTRRRGRPLNPPAYREAWEERPCLRTAGRWARLPGRPSRRRPRAIFVFVPRRTPRNSPCRLYDVARSKSTGGTVRPRALTVLTLTIISSGRSAACARTTPGHAIAVPASRKRSSRRCIGKRTSQNCTASAKRRTCPRTWPSNVNGRRFGKTRVPIEKNSPHPIRARHFPRVYSDWLRGNTVKPRVQTRNNLNEDAINSSRWPAYAQLVRPFVARRAGPGRASRPRPAH
jgi:hypothetical protein